MNHNHNRKQFNKYEIIGDTTKVYYKDIAFIIDTADLELIRQYWWTVAKRGKSHNGAYNIEAQINGKKTKLSNYLLSKQYIDHINGDTLDNRRANLRHYDDQTQNLANARRQVGQSGFRGVKVLGKNRFEARVSWKGKTIYLGTYSTPEEAAKIRDQKAKELYGEFAILNFNKEE